MKKFVKPTNPKKSKSYQPNKNEPEKKKKKLEIQKPKKQKVYKSQKITPTKTGSLKETVIRRNDTPKERKHPEYGTSNLEKRFAKNFLDKIGIKYETQFKAESIGRYYDIYIPSANLLIEIDGSYFHSYGLLYEDMSPMQKKNHRVDKDKDKWAREHKIPLIRIWEHDINEKPKEVMERLKKEITFYTEKYNKELEKKKRPTKK